MPIVAMNEIVAVVRDVKNASTFNAKKAVAELSKVRNWGQMVDFIDSHCVNELFALVRDVFRGRPYLGATDQDLIREMPGKTLSDTLSRPDMPDYLDGVDEHWNFSCPSDYQGKGFGFLSVFDLLAMRHVISGVVRTGATALGFPPPDGLCAFLSKDELLNDPYICPWSYAEVSTYEHIVKIDSRLSGCSHCGMLDASDFNEAETDTNEYAQWGDTFVFHEYISKSDAVKIATGQVTAWSINNYQHSMLPELFPFAIYEMGSSIGFDPSKGFYQEPVYSLPAWDSTMIDALKDALLSQRVALCEVCHEPFIAERKDKVHGCCGSACRQRKWKRKHLN
mgnify:CR=1 FL=1